MTVNLKSNHPTEHSADATRERILDAALRRFGRFGYVRTTTRAVAADAGINEVTLFRHFGNKRNLLLGCIQHMQKEGFVANFQQHLTGEYASDILVMAKAQAADMVRRYHVVRLLLCDSGEIPEVREIVQASSGQNAAQLAAFFQRQIENGVIRADLQPLGLAYAFDSLFSSYVFLQAMVSPGREPAVPPDEVLRTHVDLFVRGTLRQ